MTVVLADSNLREIKELFGVGSVMELPLFSEAYGERFFKNLSLFSPDKVIIYSQNTEFVEIEYADFNTEKVSEASGLERLLVNSSDNDFLLAFSDMYFEADDNMQSAVNEKKHSFFMNGNTVISAFLDKESMIGLLPVIFGDRSGDYYNSFPKTEFKGYFKSVDKPRGYKELVCDILDGKSCIRLPQLAQGVFATSKIPQGDFVIIPPVYFSENVQIESGCVIGPRTVVTADSLIAKNTHIRNSVVGEGSYVSSNCFIDGALLSENVTVRRNSTVFADTVLGKGCTVGEDCVIENGSYIKPYARIDELKKKYINFKKETNESPAGFYGYLPEKAALLGGAVGNTFGSSKLAFASDGEPNSTSLKLALLSGAMTTGTQCYDFGNTFMSSLHYFMSFCQLERAVFVSGNKNGTVITVFSKNTVSLSNSQYYSIKNIVTSGEIERCKAGECKPVRQIHGMQRMYIQNLIKNFSEPIDFLIVFNSENKYIESVAELAAAKIRGEGAVVSNRLSFNVNREGTRLTAESNGIKYNHDKLKEICSFFYEKNSIESDKNNDDLWEFDSLVLAFKIVEILYKNKISLKEAADLLPDFYVAENELSESVSFVKLVSELSEKGDLHYKEGNLTVESDGAEVSVARGDNGKLKLSVRSASQEFAKELSGDLLRVISLDIK